MARKSTRVRNNANLVLPGGRVRGGSWVPTKRICPHPPAGQQPTPPAAYYESSMHRLYNQTEDHVAALAARTRRRIINLKVAQRDCGAAASRPMPTAPTYKPNCSASSLPASVRFVLGVHTAPSAQVRRDAIRGTWLQWPNTGGTFLVCFLLGAERLSTEAVHGLREEAARYGDITLLAGAADECVLSIPKSYAWWRHAAGWLRPDGAAERRSSDGVHRAPSEGLLHVGKVRDHCITQLGTFASPFYVREDEVCATHTVDAPYPCCSRGRWTTTASSTYRIYWTTYNASLVIPSCTMGLSLTLATALWNSTRVASAGRSRHGTYVTRTGMVRGTNTSAAPAVTTCRCPS